MTLRSQDIFDADISSATVICLYLFRDGISRMREKLQAEAPPEATVVSIGFAVPQWQTKAVMHEQGLQIYIYSMQQFHKRRNSAASDRAG